MYSYDRRTAATMHDFYEKWRDIRDRYQREEAEHFAQLLASTVPYFKSVGYDLDLRKSYLGKYHKGSDGDWMDGLLYITERPENTVKAPNAQSVSFWVHEAIGIRGSAKKVDGDSWVVDITAS